MVPGVWTTRSRDPWPFTYGTGSGGYVDSWSYALPPPRVPLTRPGYWARAVKDAEKDFRRRAAAIACSVPPVGLELATRPLPAPRAPLAPVRQPGLTNRATTRERRPYRARHRTLIRRRSL